MFDLRIYDLRMYDLGKTFPACKLLLMPELPEVETIVRGLAERVTGARIESVWIGSKRQPLKSPAAKIVATLGAKTIAQVRRMGKHIVFDLTVTPGRMTPVADAQWIVHLGMTGRMLVCEPDAESVKHTHAVVTLDSGSEIRFIDARMFGKLSVHPQGGFDPGGVEPLEVDLPTFLRLFQGKKTPIKSALLDQKLLRGVGNIYADESLARIGVRPKRRAALLTRDELTRLRKAVQEVLREAIQLGGSSVSDYVGADGEEGFFQLQHRVYGREGEPCLKCRTPIKRVVIAGRSSHYCPKCQK
jgi:formamidopyrimidine-DNA glycosylase